MVEIQVKDKLELENTDIFFVPESYHVKYTADTTNAAGSDQRGHR